MRLFTSNTSFAHDVNGFTLIPEGYNRRADLPKGYVRGKTPSQPNHMLDWVNCIRTRGTPKCSTDEAFIETATYLMSVESHFQKRLVRWDPVKEIFPDDAEANKYLDRVRRKPYELPEKV